MEQQNNVVTQQDAQQPAIVVSSASLMLGQDNFALMQSAAIAMASAKVTIPTHLRGSQGDCLAVVMQAMQWRMNPYAVAQKTHLTQGGQLGYEAQLINAVVLTHAPIVGRPIYEHYGDWRRIKGKIKEMKSDKGGKYYVSDWKEADEAGLGVRIIVQLRGMTEPTVMEIDLAQCWPRFSTQWATDPEQQICFAAIRKFARRHCPDVILGVYATDELESGPIERDMGAVSEVPPRKPDANTAAVQAQATASQRAQESGVKPDELEVRLRKVAEQGVQAFEAAFRALSKPERATMVPKRDELLAIAARADENRTIESSAKPKDEPPAGDSAPADNDSFVNSYRENE